MSEESKDVTVKPCGAITGSKACLFSEGKKPKFSFVMTVLNGIPFVEYSLRSVYDFAHEIIVVEGAFEKCMFAVNPAGSSVDSTLEFIESFPDPHKKIKLIQGRWPEKVDMRNKALEYVTGDYVWLINCNEVYKTEDLEKVKSLIRSDPSIAQVNFIGDNFWKRLDYILASPKFSETRWHWRRVFKFAEGALFTNQRHPTMLLPGCELTTDQMRLISGNETRNMGIIPHNYCYTQDKQVWQKVELYRRYGWDRALGIDLNEWYHKCFLRWNYQNRVEIESKYPVWIGDKNSRTQLYKGSHQSLIMEYARKHNSAGKLYPSIPVMQNLIDTINELKNTFPNEHIEAIETGTLRTFHSTGQSTDCISQALGDRGRLTSVDISADSIRISKNFCYDALNIEWVQSDSVTYLRELKHNKFHFAFLDSVNDKDVIFDEFRLLIPMMLENSILMIDDAGIMEDGCCIDNTVEAQKAHRVWRFLKFCGAEFKTLKTPNVNGTQLKLVLYKENLKKIMNNLGKYSGKGSCTELFNQHPFGLCYEF